MKIRRRKMNRNSERASFPMSPQLQQEEAKQQRSSAMGLANEPATPAHIMQLQQTIGNKAVAQLMKAGGGIQRKSPSEKELEKGKSGENRTGMPDPLKAGIENLSGVAMDDVNVHYGSDEPAKLQALAYAQGQDIHIAPGQEKHLPHEAWHVAQQKQGRVSPTLQMEGGAMVNDDPVLESEADKMGEQALQMKSSGETGSMSPVIQLQQTEIYAKNITGSYTDLTGVHAINYPDETYLDTTKSHPKGKVSYDAQVIKQLKKLGIVPKTVPDGNVTVTYESFGRRI
jgi:hypothetical protein